MMRIADAIAKAKGIVLETTGVDCDPDFVRLERHKDIPSSWCISFSAYCFASASEQAKGTVIDGGEYIVRLDDKSGEQLQSSEF